MYPHRMRLRGPWMCQPLEAREFDKTLPQDREVSVPSTIQELGLSSFRGVLLFRRAFGQPRRLDDWERVWITFDRIEGSADIRLNGEWLTRRQSGRYARDVTALLGERNRIDVYLDVRSDTGGLTGDVALEVRALAYLENVMARRDADRSILVEGVVRGDCSDMLELYAILDRRNVHYQTQTCSPDGVPFQFSVPADQAGGSTLRIELVNRSQVWYVVESVL